MQSCREAPHTCLAREVIVDKEVAVDSAGVQNEYAKVKATASLDCGTLGEQYGMCDV